MGGMEQPGAPEALTEGNKAPRGIDGKEGTAQIGDHVVGAWGVLSGDKALGREAGGQGTYVWCEHGVAGWELVHRHREAEGAGPQAAMLQQWDPLGRGWGSGLGPNRGSAGLGGGGEGWWGLTVKPTGVSSAVPGRGWQLTW